MANADRLVGRYMLRCESLYLVRSIFPFVFLFQLLPVLTHARQGEGVANNKPVYPTQYSYWCLLSGLSFRLTISFRMQ
jgi:hypothetical protein